MASYAIVSSVLGGRSFCDGDCEGEGGGRQSERGGGWSGDCDGKGDGDCEGGGNSEGVIDGEAAREFSPQWPALW